MSAPCWAMHPEGSFPGNSHRIFDNSLPHSKERLSGLTQLYDGATQRYIRNLGVGPGWRCLDVGAGTGSVARFLADIVSPDGHVVATDINTSLLDQPLPANLEVFEHNICTDSLADHGFDLVHSRAVLAHVPEPAVAIRQMVAALRPGGWLLISEIVEASGETSHDHDQELIRKVRAAAAELVRRAGRNPRFGWDLCCAFVAAGLSQIGAEGFFVPIRTPEVVQMGVACVDELGTSLVAAGLITDDDLRGYREALARPDCLYPPSLTLVSVWGRKSPLRADLSRPTSVGPVRPV